MPPKEFKKSGLIWKLNKVVYGLCDASRSWYLRVSEVLLRLGMKKMSYDGAVFTYNTGTDFEGAMVVHVDDILYCGSPNFMARVLDPFKQTFRISKEEKAMFKYVGIGVKQAESSIVMDQDSYLDAMSDTLTSKSKASDKYRFLDTDEKKYSSQQ